jgi:hypothetical protein
MRKLILKIIILSVGTMLLLLIIHYKVILSGDYKINMPMNNVSNSPSFRAKIDHAKKSENFRKCTFLIAGSSMSLSNISGQMIANSTNETVYNISSWGFKSSQILNVLKILRHNKNIQYILIAFNNCDFDKDRFTIDYEALDMYLNGNKSSQIVSFIKKIDVQTFFDDWKYRNKYANVNNVYQSLNFDKTGSIELLENNFIIDKKRWKEYTDTTGFNFFYDNIDKISKTCKKNNIKLILVYLPYRNNLLPEQYKIHNQYIAKKMKDKYQKNFIDLHQLKLPDNFFCDANHFFKRGNNFITKLIIDSLCANVKPCILNRK